MIWNYKSGKPPLKLNESNNKRAQKKKKAIESSVENIVKQGEGKIEELYLKSNIDENISLMKNIFTGCYDVIIREFAINNGEIKSFIIYVSGVVNNEEINDNILSPLMNEIKLKNSEGENSIVNILKISNITISGASETKAVKEIVKDIFNGSCLLFVDGCDKALSLSVKGGETRQISEATVEPVLRGSAEGFVEDINTNIALIRRRIKTPELKMEKYEVGRISKTIVIIAYLKGLANDSAVEEIRKRINKIDVDMIVESGNIEHFIEDSRLSPFPQMELSERPDRSALALADGRIVTLIDGTPFVLLLPTVFADFLISVEDNYVGIYFAQFIIIIRYISFLTALLLPSIYIAITTYHQEMIPYQLLTTIANSRLDVPFPVFLEALLMEGSFDLLREAGERLPRPISQSLSIVGTIVLGQAAIQSGLVSPVMVVVLSITATASFVNPKINMVRSVRILRFPIMILAATIGIYGIIMGLLVLLIHMASLRSVGVPYLSPSGPLNIKDWKNSIFKLPLWIATKRPSFIQKNNVKRVKEELQPNQGENN
jgi:spore germination protein KA